MIPQNVIDDILARVSIVDIVGRDVELKRAGKNWTGLCPFHSEKTPSFTVSEDKGFYHCFGCKASGNAVKFLMEHRKMTFREAIEELAAKAGIDLSRFETAGETEGRSDKERLYAANREAISYYHKLLTDDESGKGARDYIAKRGIAPEIVSEFRLGYGGNQWDGLCRHLKAKGFKDEEILKASLGSQGQKGLIDKFRERLIFPIFDKDGKPVGFGGRILESGAQTAKYINTAESVLFHKGNLLFGLNAAKDEVVRKKACMIVEGYMDALACYQHGIRNAVAPLGTAFTESQLMLVKRYCNEVLFMFDGDNAGIKAADHAVNTIREGNNFEYKKMIFNNKFNNNQDIDSKIDKMAGVNINQYIVILPENLDPFDYLMKYGVASLRKYIKENRMYPLDFKLHYYSQSENYNKDRLIFVKNVFDYIKNMGSRIIIESYLEKISKYTNIDLAIIKSEFERYMNHNKSYGKELKIVEEARNSIPPIEARFAALIAVFPEAMAEIKTVVTAEMFEHPAPRAIFEFILDNADKRLNEILSQTTEESIVETATEIAVGDRSSAKDAVEFAYRVRLAYLKREHDRITRMIAGGVADKSERDGLLKMQTEIARKKDEIGIQLQNMATENA